IEQAAIRGHDDDQRERNHGAKEQTPHEPPGPRPLAPRHHTGHETNHGQPTHHHSSPPIASAELFDGKHRTALHPPPIPAQRPPRTSLLPPWQSTWQSSRFVTVTDEIDALTLALN